MSEADTRSSKRSWVIAGVCLLVVVAVVWGVTGRGPDEPKSTLPPELSVESLKAQATDPGKMRELLDRHDRDDMTEEQRRELRGNMREVFRSVVDDRMAEYFAAAEADRNAVLDRHIDEFQKQMARWQEERERRQREGEEGDRPNFHERFASQTREERKASSENRNPDEMAQRMLYFTAVRERMAQRGLEMPPWGPGGFGRGGPGRGGPGGGPGGPGGGERGGGGRGPGGDR